MKRRYIAGLAGVVLLTGSISIYRHLHRPETPLTPYEQQVWLGLVHPKIDLVIARFDARGLDTTRAKALCDGPVITVEASDRCVDELERLESSTSK